MSEPLWQYEDYVRFTQHGNPEVRRWALKWLEKYGLQAKEVIAALIEDEHALVRTAATRFLGQFGSAEDGPRLLQAFQVSRGNQAGQYAAALGNLRYTPALPVLLERLRSQPDTEELFGLTAALAQLGGPEAQAALRSLVEGASENDWVTGGLVEDLLRLGEARDIPFVVARYFELPPPPQGNRMLDAFQQATNTDRLVAAFRSCEGRLDRMLEEAEEWGLRARDNLSPPFVEALAGRSSGRDYEDTVQMIHLEALRWSHPRGWDLHGENRPALMGLPSHQRLAWTRLLFIDAFAEAVGRLSRRERRRRRRIGGKEVEFLLATLVRLADTPDDEARLNAAEDRTAALFEILSEDREEVPDEFVAEVKALGPAAVPALQKILEEDPESWAALRAAEVMEALAQSSPEACLPAIPALMNGLRDEVGDLVKEKCMAALQRLGEPVLDEAARVLAEGDSSQKLYLMSVLEEIPVERSVDLLLEHYDALLEEWGEPVVEALKSLGSARAIELLRPDALRGEAVFEEAFLVLCDLHGLDLEELGPLRAAHEKREAQLNAQLEALESATSLADLLPGDEEEMRLKLKCRTCRRVYTYEVGQVFYCTGEEDQEKAFFFQRRIVCKNCGAEDQYELTSEAHLALTVELIKITIRARDRGPAPPGASRLQILENFTLADGTRCTPLEAVEIYRERIAQDPTNPEHRFRFGNVLRFLGRIEEAQEQYEEAVRLDPTCIQAHFNLGTLALERGHRSLMEVHLEQVLAHAPRSTDPQRQELASIARDLLAGREPKVELSPLLPASEPPETRASYLRERRRRRQEWPAPPSLPARVPKIGRNEPCPCGSGKKYKKCCGR